MMVEIQENYKDYDAPRCVIKSVRRLIRYTPKKYLAGLHLINLTNTDALNRKSRRQKTLSRKRKVELNRCYGWYYKKDNNQPARIELLVDNIYYDFPSLVLRIGFISDIALADTFFHELGHHIHRTIAPEHTEREDVAEKWKKRLSRRYFWKRYWHIMVIFLLFRPLFAWLSKKYGDELRQASQ